MAAGQPETLYQQNHCGIYRSDDGSEHAGMEITADGLPSEFGFPMVAHPRDPDTAGSSRSTAPIRAASCPTAHAGGLADATTAGASWIRCDAGLPTRDAYLAVLREAMARDTLDPVGITFGTETGQLWHSSDEGESWRMITDTLPEIWAVEAVVLDG